MRNRKAEQFTNFLNAKGSHLSRLKDIFEDLEWLSNNDRRLLPQIHREIARVMRDFLRGENVSTFEKKINQPMPAQRWIFIERPLGKHHASAFDSRKAGNLHVKDIRLGKKDFCMRVEIPPQRTLKRVLYFMLLGWVKNDEIRRFSLCERTGCNDFIFQTTRPKRFCGARCRWQVFNTHENRKHHIDSKTGRWKPRVTHV